MKNIYKLNANKQLECRSELDSYELKDNESLDNEYLISTLPEEKLKAIRKQERNRKLTDGIIVNNIWFNEDRLTQFTVMAQMVSSMGQPTFEWGFEDGFAPITVEDAFNTVMSASAQFQQIYKDYK